MLDKKKREDSPHNEWKKKHENEISQTNLKGIIKMTPIQNIGHQNNNNLKMEDGIMPSRF